MAIQEACMQYGIKRGTAFFSTVSITSTDDLQSLSDSVLRMSGIEDEERLVVLETIAYVSGDMVPRISELKYAFDVDGTLTPHAGADPHGLWSLDPDEYYRSLTLEQRDRMIYRLVCLPVSITLISRNRQENVVRLLYLLNSHLPNRISRSSSFRSSGVCPTGTSKREALKWLICNVHPVIYADDSLEEIAICRSLGSIHSYHVQTWLGDPVEWARFLAWIPVEEPRAVCHC